MAIFSRKKAKHSINPRQKAAIQRCAMIHLLRIVNFTFELTAKNQAKGYYCSNKVTAVR